MFRQISKLGWSAVAALALAAFGSTAHAQVGNPTGSFEITVTQDGNEIAKDTVTIGPGGDLSDLSPTFVDGTPESNTQIGTTASGAPIILKVVSDGGALEGFRLTHWYIDVPLTTDLIDIPGPDSLFDPTGGPIDVEISSFEFDNGALVTPLVLNSPNFYTSFTRDISGNFYETAGSNSFNQFGNGFIDIQVPGSLYLDGDTDAYNFEMLASGASASWRWSNILNPGLATMVNDGAGNTVAPVSPGYVFELGTAVAFVAIPEPATAGLFMLGGATLLARRRRK